MTQLTVTLGFTCCGCQGPVTVTVQCSGLVPHDADLPLPSVNVPCPSCGQISRLTFDPTGRVRQVRPIPCFRIVPEPSIN